MRAAIMVVVLAAAALARPAQFAVLNNGSYVQTHLACTLGAPDPSVYFKTLDVCAGRDNGFVFRNVPTVAGAAGGFVLGQPAPSGAVRVVVPPAQQGENFLLCVGWERHDLLNLVCIDDGGAQCNVVYAFQQAFNCT